MSGSTAISSPHGPQGVPAMDTDVIVIGAGPSGMSAAVELATAGRKVIVLDMQPTPGGQIFRALETNVEARPATDLLLAALGETYSAGLASIREFRRTPGIDYRPGTTVWDLRSDGTVGWLKDEAAGYIRAKHLILANGAMERPTPFPGWTLPGVMTAGAVQTLLKAGRLQPQGDIVLAGTGPLIFLLADQLRRLGVKPRLIARTDRLDHKFAGLAKLALEAIPAITKGLGWLSRLRLAGIPIRTGISDLVAHGDERIEAVSMTVADKRVRFPCDLLVVHDGIVPATDLAHCAGIALEWNDTDATWTPKTALDGLAELAPGPAFAEGVCRIHITGDARRIGGADAAIIHGRHVAASVLRLLDPSSRSDLDTTAVAVSRSLKARPFIDTAFPIGLASRTPQDGTLVCRCEELTAGTLRDLIRGGTNEMNLIRGVSRCGMGPCQGRSCAITLARLLAEEGGSAGNAPTPFRARPPLRPLPLGALANLTGLDPELAQVISLDDKPDASAEGDSHA
ncbi:NAD(P)/FAD-dependent oxidoreductase [Sinorhizobium meliloti]|nr:FAD/NAD(P)-binding oxidoreductase [Sinorhizobium meliloti]